MNEKITTISFFKYVEVPKKFWAFFMMQYGHRYLKKVNGLSFYRLMGSGKNGGFNPFPDWSVYALLQVWDDEASAELFFNTNSLFAQYQTKATEIWTLHLRNIAVHGSWNSVTPFAKEVLTDPEAKIAVLTRATIKWNKLIQFWRYVPTSQQNLKENEGLLFSIGVGEVPILQMATFSLWNDQEALKKFAYHSAGHREAIKKTKELNWYKEELFSRFQVIKTTGSWNGETREV